MGKLGTRDLEKMLSCIKKDRRLIVPPLPGFDSGVHIAEGNGVVVVSTDPCVGVPLRWFGWLLVHYAASDVALFGAKPEFCTINLLGPPCTKPETFQRVMRQVCAATDELDMAIVTGHTGTYEALSALIGICTAYGNIDPRKLITSGGAQAGDYVLCTKPLGLELAINFAFSHGAAATKIFGEKERRNLGRLVPMQSCVKDALHLAQFKGVHAMHDATEGGFITALNEMADASKLGFRVDFETIPISTEVQRLEDHFCLSKTQLLSTSSTGTILAAVSPAVRQKVEHAMSRENIRGSFVGAFTENRSRILLKQGKETKFPDCADDPYARILSGRV